ncbi:MAG: hypothetical protein WBA97_08175 [Actinophytocola sp.]|uniref:hypothetical protein n=1 Tax=Actinophytocola sp. TaxID=1872138 RepID=UPI003C7800AD
MDIDLDLREMRSIPAERRSDWMMRRFSDRVPPLWCRAVFVVLEDNLNSFRAMPAGQRSEEFAFAAEFVSTIVDVGGIKPGMGGRWMLGLAYLALRFDPPIPDMPVVLSPDGAAEWALRHISFTREQAIAEAEARREWHRSGDEVFYVPGSGMSLTGKEAMFAELLDVEFALGGLEWISAYVQREEIAREVRDWLEIRGEL